jgi:alpha-methylacyl-CoA racemase
MIYGLQADGLWGERGTNLLDTGAWFYEVYKTADGEHISLGPIEPQFLARMLELTGLAADVDGRGPIPDQQDQSTWPDMKDRVAALIKTRTRDAWSKILEAGDACFAPVLSVEEAAAHPHNVAGGNLHHGRRGDPSQPGPPLQPHRAGHRRAGAVPGPRHRAGPRRSGLLTRGDQRGEVGLRAVMFRRLLRGLRWWWRWPGRLRGRASRR